MVGALKLSVTNRKIFIIDICIVSLLFLPSEAPNFFLKFFFPMLSVKINTCVSYHSMFNVTQALENLFSLESFEGSISLQKIHDTCL